MFNLVDDYCTWLILHDRSPQTAYRHKCILKILLKYCLENGGFTKSTVETFLVLRKTDGARHSYLNHFVGTARVYARFLIHRGLECDTGLLELKQFREQDFQKATMSDDEIEAFLGLPPKEVRRFTHGVERLWCANLGHYYKFKMFWECCAYSGARTGEVAKIKIDDVDFGRNVFVIHESKIGHRGGTRLVPIAPHLKDKLVEYIKNLKGEYLFPSEGKSVSPIIRNVDWGYDFHDRINRLSIRRTNLSPYSLRHSLITRLLEEDVNIFKVQKIVGHRNIDTTAKYTHLTTKDIQNAIMKHPMIRKHTDPIVTIKALSDVIESFDLKNNQGISYSFTSTGDSLSLFVKIKTTTKKSSARSV